MSKIAKRIVIGVIAVILLSALGTVAYLSIGVKGPQDSARAALQSDTTVTVTQAYGVTTYTGPDADPQNTYGFVFYQGAKVENEAYAPLLHALAASGWTCVSVEAPLNFAIFSANFASEAIAAHPEVEHWYVGGHSFGGLTASTYAASNADKLDGLVFLGAYTTSNLTQSGLNIISLYGSNDTVLNKDAYNEGKALLPESFHELIIDGGNHAQFGDYGEQENDSPATIAAATQVEETVAFITANR